MNVKSRKQLRTLWVHSAYGVYQNDRAGGHLIGRAMFKSIANRLLTDILEQGVFEHSDLNVQGTVDFTKHKLKEHPTEERKKPIINALCKAEVSIAERRQALDLSKGLRQAWVNAVKRSLEDDFNISAEPLSSQISMNINKFINQNLTKMAASQSIEITDDNFFEDHIVDERTNMGLVETLLSHTINSPASNENTIAIRRAMKLTYSLDFDIPTGP